MLLFVESQNFVKELSASFHSLCTDKHAQIRRTIALGFHEVERDTPLLVEALTPVHLSPIRVCNIMEEMGYYATSN